jgi:hypothetical protein
VQRQACLLTGAPLAEIERNGVARRAQRCSAPLAFDLQRAVGNALTFGSKLKYRLSDIRYQDRSFLCSARRIAACFDHCPHRERQFRMRTDSASERVPTECGIVAACWVTKHTAEFAHRCHRSDGGVDSFPGKGIYAVRYQKERFVDVTEATADVRGATSSAGGLASIGPGRGWTSESHISMTTCDSTSMQAESTTQECYLPSANRHARLSEK